MLPQEEIIEKLRKVCQQDERLAAAMLYGSFTKGEGDEFSDVDVCLFFEDDALKKINPHQWVSQIAPVELYYINQYGSKSWYDKINDGCSPKNIDNFAVSNSLKHSSEMYSC